MFWVVLQGGRWFVVGGLFVGALSLLALVLGPWAGAVIIWLAWMGVDHLRGKVHDLGLDIRTSGRVRTRLVGFAASDGLQSRVLVAAEPGASRGVPGCDVYRLGDGDDGRGRSGPESLSASRVDMADESAELGWSDEAFGDRRWSDEELEDRLRRALSG
jgi:hypothetical protein